MQGERLADLDELVLRCRDEQARRYISEAAACYRAGAFRSCIVATWTAVVYDFIHKLRQLEMTGDKNARRILTEFEAHRRNEDLAAAQEFEREVLSVAKEQFELLTPLESDDLERLRTDRHKCAHPSMHSLDEPYVPSAELARYHIRNAVTHLLQRPPVQGKATLDLIWADIASGYFPRTTNEAVAFLKTGPLERARDSLIRSVVVGLSKDLLTEDRDAAERSRQFAALTAVLQMYVELGEQTLREDLPRIASGLEDDRFPNLVTYLRQLPRTWEFLPDHARIRTQNYVRSAPVDALAPLLVDALHLPALAEIATARVPEIPIGELGEQVEVEVTAELVDECIRHWVTADSFIKARTVARRLLLGVAGVLTAEQLKVVVAAFVENEQLLHAFDVPYTMAEVFKLTERHAEEAKDEWLRVHRVMGRESFEQTGRTLRRAIESWFPQASQSTPALREQGDNEEEA
jgi:hypothetical protein